MPIWLAFSAENRPEAHLSPIWQSNNVRISLGPLWLDLSSWNSPRSPPKSHLATHQHWRTVDANLIGFFSWESPRSPPKSHLATQQCQNIAGSILIGLVKLKLAQKPTQVPFGDLSTLEDHWLNSVQKPNPFVRPSSDPVTFGQLSYYLHDRDLIVLSCSLCFRCLEWQDHITTVIWYEQLPWEWMSQHGSHYSGLAAV